MVHFFHRRHHHRVVWTRPIRDRDRPQRLHRHRRVRRSVHRLYPVLAEQSVGEFGVHAHDLLVEPFDRAGSRRPIGVGQLRRTRDVVGDLADEPRLLRVTRRAGELVHVALPGSSFRERERQLLRVLDDIRRDDGRVSILHRGSLEQGVGRPPRRPIAPGGPFRGRLVRRSPAHVLPFLPSFPTALGSTLLKLGDVDGLL